MNRDRIAELREEYRMFDLPQTEEEPSPLRSCDCCGAPAVYLDFHRAEQCGIDTHSCLLCSPLGNFPEDYLCEALDLEPHAADPAVAAQIVKLREAAEGL